MRLVSAHASSFAFLSVCLWLVVPRRAPDGVLVGRGCETADAIHRDAAGNQEGQLSAMPPGSQRHNVATRAPNWGTRAADTPPSRRRTSRPHPMQVGNGFYWC